jgi:hypothetical protein
MLFICLIFLALSGDDGTVEISILDYFYTSYPYPRFVKCHIVEVLSTSKEKTTTLQLHTAIIDNLQLVPTGNRLVTCCKDFQRVPILHPNTKVVQLHNAIVLNAICFLTPIIDGDRPKAHSILIQSCHTAQNTQYNQTAATATSIGN